jgi:hypothetical protein
MCNACTMTSPTRHRASLHLGHGCGSWEEQAAGDIMMPAKFEFIMRTAVDESPESYKEQMMRVIDELHQTLKEGTSSPDFWKTQAETVGP